MCVLTLSMIVTPEIKSNPFESTDFGIIWNAPYTREGNEIPYRDPETVIYDRLY